MIWVVDETARHVSSAQQSGPGWYAASLTSPSTKLPPLGPGVAPRTSHLAACMHSCVSAMLPSVVVGLHVSSRRGGRMVASARVGKG